MTAKLFTNDTLLFSVIHDSGASSISFNDDFLKISRWPYQWKMAFNTDASKQVQEIVFSHKPSPTNHGHIPDGMRCLWEILIRSPLREISERPLRNISKEMLFCVTFLRRLKCISKKDIFYVTPLKTTPPYLKKDVYSVTLPISLKNISCKYLWLFKINSQQRFRVISVELLKYLIK